MQLSDSTVSYLTQLCIGTGRAFTSEYTYIGVGNSTTANTASDTDLKGSSKFRKKVDAGYPKYVAPNKLIFKATFAPEDANFAWNEWGIFNGSSGNQMLVRTVESNGIKQDNQTWVLEVTVSLSST